MFAGMSRMHSNILDIQKPSTYIHNMSTDSFMSANPAEPGRSQAIALIILLGAVSLFTDMNHEGGRSLSGQCLDLLGAGAFWFVGSALSGWLYGLSVLSMVVASVFFQGIALALSFVVHNALKKEEFL
jgi:hypothetical protein